jgi:L-lactate utilization protein LutB
VAALVQDVAAGSGAGPGKVIIEPSLVCRRDLERLLGNGTRLLDPHAGDQAMFSADVGVTGVYAAVAETGSLVCVSGPELWRGLSLIPPVHIAVVWHEQIVPDLVDLFTARLPTDLPASLTLISGPSKTADIEGILITGVHGPGSVHVVVVRESRTELRS